MRLIRGKAVSVAALGGDVACGPEVLLGQRGVKRLRGGDGIARRVEAAIGEGDLRRESGGGEEEGEREEGSQEAHRGCGSND